MTMKEVIVKAGGNENSYSVSVTYGVLYDFKDIVRMLRTNGAMQDSLFTTLSVDSILELREAQLADHALRNVELISDEAALTMVTIKILNEYFAKDQKLWGLIERKARKFILTTMRDAGLTKEGLDAALTDLKPCFDEFKKQ